MNKNTELDSQIEAWRKEHGLEELVDDELTDLKQIIATQRSYAAREVLEQFRDRFMGDMPFIVSDEEEAGRWVLEYIEELTKQAEEGEQT
jgi:hypothetical protein